MDESDPKKDEPDPDKDELDENIDEPAANIIGSGQNNDGLEKSGDELDEINEKPGENIVGSNQSNDGLGELGDESDPNDKLIISNDQEFPLGDQRIQHPNPIVEFYVDCVIPLDQEARFFRNSGIPLDEAGLPPVVLRLSGIQAAQLYFLMDMTRNQRTVLVNGLALIPDRHASRFYELSSMLFEAFTRHKKVILYERIMDRPTLGEIADNVTKTHTTEDPRGPRKPEPAAKPSNSTSKRTVMVCIVVAAGIVIVIGAHQIKKKFFDKK